MTVARTVITVITVAHIACRSGGWKIDTAEGPGPERRRLAMAPGLETQGPMCKA